MSNAKIFGNWVLGIENLFMLYLFIALSIISNVLANTSLKIGADRLKGLSWQAPVQSFIKIIIDVPLIGGAILFVFSFVCYIYLLNRENLSLIYPITTSLSLVLVTVVSMFYLHESLRWLQIVGIVLIVFGVLFVAHR